ncbi:MAG: EH signature domain-containing protein [Galactobacter sp.]
MRFDLDLPSAESTLSARSASSRREWERLIERTETLTRSAGQGSAFEAFRKRARQLLKSTDPVNHPDVRDRRMARAVVTLWADDPELAKDTLRTKLLRMATTAGAGSRLFTYTLARVYFTYFDSLNAWETGLLEALSDTLREQTELLKQSPRADLKSAFKKLPEFCSTLDGPRELAKAVVLQGTDLESTMRTSGLGDYRTGRYAELARQYVYLDQIRAADPRIQHDFLTDFRDQPLTQALMSDGRLFGHHVLEALADVEGEPGHQWQQTALDIAGDPRARESTSWSRWWSAVSKETRDRVIGWLSTRDLELFLESVQAYGETEDKTDLLRMFPDRKDVLEGLNAQGLIRETRLFAGTKARPQLRHLAGEYMTTKITPLVGANTLDLSVIVIDCGPFQIVEGSHSFKMWCFVDDGLTLFPRWSSTSVNRDELTKNIASHIGLDSYLAVAHHSKKWLSDLLLFLEKHGIPLDPQSIMSRETYEFVNRSYALPVATRKPRK